MIIIKKKNHLKMNFKLLKQKEHFKIIIIIIIIITIITIIIKKMFLNIKDLRPILKKKSQKKI